MISPRVSPHDFTPVPGLPAFYAPSAAALVAEDDRLSTHLADAWFSMLDQRCFCSGSERWISLVTGIHHVGRDVWIQLECALNVHCSLVLHVTPETTLHDALRAIERAVTGSPAR